MEFKGTKGKWEVKPADHVGSILVCFGDFNGKIELWYHHGDTKEEIKANAQLISKAPEMLEMLEKVLNNSDVPNEIYDQAKQLIKEATTTE